MALSNADIAARVTARAAVEKSAAGPAERCGSEGRHGQRGRRRRRTPRGRRPRSEGTPRARRPRKRRPATGRRPRKPSHATAKGSRRSRWMPGEQPRKRTAAAQSWLDRTASSGEAAPEANAHRGRNGREKQTATAEPWAYRSEREGHRGDDGPGSGEPTPDGVTVRNTRPLGVPRTGESPAQIRTTRGGGKPWKRVV